jgi:S1-C subfamily serine protease
VRVADQLIKTGTVQHPFLGLVGQTVTDAIVTEKKLPVSAGALVISTFKGTGAETAGLKADDIIVQLDSVPIRSMEDLIRAVRDSDIGQVVTLKVYRGGKPIELKMTVGVKPANLD